MNSLADRLHHGVFISSMMSWTTGAFVTEHGQGAAMVQIGALVADLEDRSHSPRFLLPEAQADMVPILAAHVEAIRAGLGDIPIALNAAPGDLESALRMARAFHEAGGDIFELNCHGGYGKLLERGLLRAMALPENRPTMVQWLEALGKLDTAIVVKLNGHAEGAGLADVLRDIAHIERLLGVHINVRSVDREEPNLKLVQQLRPLVTGVLFCSGHVKSRQDVDDLTKAGCDCVGVAQGLLDDPHLIGMLTAVRPGRLQPSQSGSHRSV